MTASVVTVSKAGQTDIDLYLGDLSKRKRIQISAAGPLNLNSDYLLFVQ